MNKKLHLPTPSYITGPQPCSAITANYYFHMLPRSWNALPIIDLTL